MSKSYIVYSTETCKFCKEAKTLLTEEGLPFEVRDLNDPEHPEYRRFIVDEMGFKTVPQIFERVGDPSVPENYTVEELYQHIGGFYDLRKHLKG